MSRRQTPEERERRIAEHEARQAAKAAAARLERTLRSMGHGRRRPHPRTARAQAEALRERADG